MCFIVKHSLPSLSFLHYRDVLLLTEQLKQHRYKTQDATRHNVLPSGVLYITQALRLTQTTGISAVAPTCYR